jgi:hypothetical protein
VARAGFAERRRKSGPEHLNSSGTWVFGLYDATMLSRLSTHGSVACTIAGEEPPSDAISESVPSSLSLLHCAKARWQGRVWVPLHGAHMAAFNSFLDRIGMQKNRVRKSWLSVCT